LVNNILAQIQVSAHGRSPGFYLLKTIQIPKKTLCLTDRAGKTAGV